MANRITHTYTNNSGNYQLVGNCEKAVFEGTLQECEKLIDTHPLDISPYTLVEIFAPGETKSHEFVPGLTREEIDAVLKDKPNWWPEK